MLKSLQWRLVCIFVLLTFFLVAPISLFLNNKIESWYYNGFRKSIESGFKNWQVKSGDDPDLVIRYLRDERNAISQFQINEYKSYTILPRKSPGNIVFTSDPIYEGGANKVQFTNEITASDNLLEVISGSETGDDNKLVRYGDRSYLDYARAFTLEDGDYILYFRYDSDAWQSDINDFNIYVLSALLILIAISLVFGYLMSKTITVPIIRVMNKAKSLADGNFDQLLEVKSEDEIGQLTRAFNVMATSLMNTMKEISKLDSMRREFVANVSHELRTPLTSIKSYTESLLDEGADTEDDTRKRFLGVINSEADRMTRLVKDLLQLSSLDNRQMRWNMEIASFADTVRLAVEKMQIEAASKRHTLTFSAATAAESSGAIEVMPMAESSGTLAAQPMAESSGVLEALPMAVFDKDRIQQVVLNLLSNAIKYTPEDGTITAEVGYDRRDGMVYLKVADNGIGIPEEDLPRIFERFYRVDKARSREMGGTGLGLAIAKEIVEAHSGTISLVSGQGRGTEVTVRLPLSQPEPAAVISAAQQAK